MKIFTPSYYKDFKCIGEKCKHNCCIGWEIDIDRDTMQKYENTEGVFKKRLDQCIDKGGEAPCFILDDNKRCPFLNKDNLCDIIISLGEDNLCEICNAHPRFYNFFSDREEIGLGMCCEEAARIILTQDKGFSLIRTRNKEKAFRPLREEKRVISQKKKLLRTVNNGRSAINILDILSAYTGTDIQKANASSFLELLLGLEIMDEGWRALLLSVKRGEFKFTVEKYEGEFINILSYFLYRHISYGEYSHDIRTAVLFCVFSAVFITSVCDFFSASFGQLLEICRLYSAEVEYSTENTEVIMDALERGVI